MRLPRRKIHYRRRYFLIPILVMMIIPILIVWFNTVNRSNVLNTNSDSALPSPYCQKGDPLTGVYNPLRFRVLSNCEVASGTVNSTSSRPDGSLWILVKVDGKYSRLISTGNVNNQNGLLVLEELAPDNMISFSIGERINIVGPLVYDVQNQFNAICPVWSIVPS